MLNDVGQNQPLRSFAILVFLKGSTYFARFSMLLASFLSSLLLWQFFATESAYASWDDPITTFAVSGAISIGSLVLSELLNKVSKFGVQTFIAVLGFSLALAYGLYSQGRHVQEKVAIQPEVRF